MYLPGNVAEADWRAGAAVARAVIEDGRGACRVIFTMGIVIE